MVGAEKITGAIFGAILVIYLIANTFNDTGDELAGINESHKGGTIVKLAGLFLAFGVVIALYRMLVSKS